MNKKMSTNKTSKITEEHYQTHSIVEVEHFPEHNERKETLEFRNAKHELEVVEHLPCYICGTMKKRESHHIFERAYWNALDLVKVSFYLYNHYDYHGHCKRDFKSDDELFHFFVQHFNGREVEYEYEDEDGNMQTDKYWTCDDEAADYLFNQLILDEICHRASGKGAHGTSAPTFYARMAARKGYEISISQKEYEAMLKKQK